jgi:hypothetical protein
LQFASLRNTLLHEGFFFLVKDQALDRFGHGVRGIQIERFFGQLFGLAPIGLHDGMSAFHQGVRQDGARHRIVFVQFKSAAQELDCGRRLLLREKVLTFIHQLMSFGFPFQAILREVLKLRQFRIVGKFGSRSC